MVDAFVDYVNGNAGNSGLTDFSNAKLLLQDGINVAGAGGRVFVKTDAAGTFLDTAATSRDITGTAIDNGNPVRIYGCKSTATAPVTQAELAVQGVDNLPTFQATGLNNDIGFQAVAECVGLRFDAADEMSLNSNDQWTFENCEMTLSRSFLLNQATNAVKCVNTVWIPKGVGFFFSLNNGAFLGIFGGKLDVSTAVPTKLFDSGGNGTMFARGFDMSGLTTIIVDVEGFDNAFYRFFNCSISPSLTAVLSGTFDDDYTSIEFNNCTSDTGLGSTDTNTSFAKGQRSGSCLFEETIIRNAPASDGVKSYAYKLLPVSNATAESSQAAVATNWFAADINGDGTNQTLSVYVANDKAEGPAGLLKVSQLRLEVMFPDPLGTSTYKFVYNDDYDPLGTTTNVAVDTSGVGWATGANNLQQLVATIDPAYIGWAMARVVYSERFASTPATLFVTPVAFVT